MLPQARTCHRATRRMISLPSHTLPPAPSCLGSPNLILHPVPPSPTRLPPPIAAHRKLRDSLAPITGWSGVTHSFNGSYANHVSFGVSAASGADDKSIASDEETCNGGISTVRKA